MQPTENQLAVPMPPPDWTGCSSVSWAPYDGHRRCTMLLGATCGPADAPYEDERRFWAARTPGDAPSSTPMA